MPTKHDAIGSSSRIFKWLQSIIAIIAVVGGLGINWGITKSELAITRTQITEIKEARKQEQTLYKVEMGKIQEEIIELRLEQATTDAQYKAIMNALKELKDDVKALRRPQ